MKKIQTYSLSFTGRRENNQDAELVYKPTKNSMFLAVADGMGGVAGGQVASRLVINNAKRVLDEKFKNPIKPIQLKDILIHIFYSSQKVIKEKIKEKPELNGMGTTLTCVLILDDKFVWGNLGDSRIYYYSNNILKQITRDHTHIQEYSDSVGNDIPENIVAEYGHYLTRSIDGGSDEPDIFPDVIPYEKLNEGDAFLLSCDGLILDKSKQDDEHFTKYLIGTNSLKEAAENLISFAYLNGSTDNISVILAAYGKLKRKRLKLNKYSYPPIENKKNKKKFSVKSAAFITLILVVLTALFCWYFNLITVEQIYDLFD